MEANTFIQEAERADAEGGRILVCGGGLIETDSARRYLAEVHVARRE